MHKKKQQPVHAAFDSSKHQAGILDIRRSILKLVQHRFAAFYAKFGREPGPNEELFFDESQPDPVRASYAQIREQIIAAACERKLDALALLKFLGFSTGDRNSH